MYYLFRPSLLNWGVASDTEIAAQFPFPARDLKPSFFEYEEVLRRPRSFPHLSPKDIEDVLDFIASACDHVRINFLWRPQLPVPDDDLILELAVSGNAKAIVTYNQRDFVGSEQFGVRIISPGEFLKELTL